MDRKLWLWVVMLGVVGSVSCSRLVIGARGAGFFSEFFMVLNWLVYCKKHDLAPIVIWQQGSNYYQQEGYHGQTNAWNYYFEPVSNHVPYDNDPQVRDYCSEWGIDAFDAAWVEEHRPFVNALIAEHIHIQPWIMEKKAIFYTTYMKDRVTIGIHVRRTDKYAEVRPVPLREYVSVAEQCRQQFPDCQFLVATDQYSILKALREKLGGRVIYYDALRSHSNKPLHLASRHPARIGEDVLIETLLLAECDFLIHAQSNVAVAALFFNPNLPHCWLQPPPALQRTKSVSEGELSYARLLEAIAWIVGIT